MNDYSYIQDWTEADLGNLPTDEDETHEYKSSKIADQDNWHNALKPKIQKAASAFWNSGGGIFVVGVDDSTGQVDGGIPDKVGNQPIKDWVDQVLIGVTPIASYTVHLVTSATPDSKIQPNMIVLVIGFSESHLIPHRALDHEYYIRSGRQSYPANHYIVEALFARRNFVSPVLRAMLMRHEINEGIVQFMVLCVNDSPAINVHINIQPPPNVYKDSELFPIEIPVVDQRHPFRLDITAPMLLEEQFSSEPVTVVMQYEDTLGRPLLHEQVINPKNHVATYQANVEWPDAPKKSLKRMADEIAQIRILIWQYIKNLNDNEEK